MRCHAKIVATIGPATRGAGMIDALLDEGMSVARVNCAHGSHDELRDTIALLRERAEQRRVPLAVLADLAGPKLRVGRFAGGVVELEPGGDFTLTTTEVLGDERRASINYAGLPAEVRPGDAVFLDDGLIQLTVIAVTATAIRTRVAVGGRLSDRKGLSVPGAATGLPSLTEKDLADLACVVGAGVDYVGLSFVRSAGDIAHLREALERAGGAGTPVVAKIEKAQAVEALPAIIAAADAVMVARGDLGVECPIDRVPMLQKRIIRLCNEAGCPVITATQMLESMVAQPRPTRAEASDVANAVLDGSDALMLSAETAMGRYPAAAVRTMRDIIRHTEEHGPACAPPEDPTERELTPGDAVARSACLAAASVRASAVVCLTQSGATARHLARWRPAQRIIAVTPRADTWRRLSLVWDVEPVLGEPFGDDFDTSCRRILAALRESGRLKPGPVVITAGLPFSQQGKTNTLRIEAV